jgi:AcrR family transcriptional regulator
MGRDAEATRRRLLDAAREEFSAHGIAGARVDRIAAAARSNKAQIYHYYGSKDGLFDAVFDAMVRETLDDVPIDAADLPEYAGRLYDSYRRRPWVQRIATWYRLERAGSSDLLPAVVASNTAKVRAIAAAQAAGTLPTRFSAPELLGLVIHLSSLWSASMPEFETLVEDGSPDRRRQVIVDAVAAVASRPARSDDVAEES